MGLQNPQNQPKNGNVRLYLVMTNHQPWNPGYIQINPDVSGCRYIPDVSGYIPDVSGYIPDVSGYIRMYSDISGYIPDVSGYIRMYPGYIRIYPRCIWIYPDISKSGYIWIYLDISGIPRLGGVLGKGGDSEI
jgi:hypothetical protein